MKTIAYLVVCCSFLLAGSLQAADVPFIELKGHTDTVRSVTFSPDGKKIVTASGDGTIRVWDTESGKELRSMKGYGISVAFSPDGTKIVTAGGQENVQIWDANSGKQLRKLERRRSLGDRIFRSVATVIPEFGTSAVFSSDGKKIVTGGYGIILIWDAESGREISQMSDKDGARAWPWIANISPDGEKIVTAGHGTRDLTVRIWDVASGQEERRLVGHTDSVLVAAFSPDGKKSVTGSEDKTARVFDVDSAQELQKLAGHSGRVTSVVFLADGKRIGTASGNGVRIWDAESGEELQKMEEHPYPVYAAAFSPDGKKIALTHWSDKDRGDRDHNTRIWVLE